MKKLTIFLMIIFSLSLTSCGQEECQTKACFDYKLEQEKIKQEQIEKERAFSLEQLKIQAEIEKAKPVEVKVQELKNEETTFGEGMVQSVGIAGATAVGGYLLSKILD